MNARSSLSDSIPFTSSAALENCVSVTLRPSSSKNPSSFATNARRCAVELRWPILISVFSGVIVCETASAASPQQSATLDSQQSFSLSSQQSFVVSASVTATSLDDAGAVCSDELFNAPQPVRSESAASTDTNL